MGQEHPLGSDVLQHPLNNITDNLSSQIENGYSPRKKIILRDTFNRHDELSRPLYNALLPYVEKYGSQIIQYIQFGLLKLTDTEKEAHYLFSKYSRSFNEKRIIPSHRLFHTKQLTVDTFAYHAIGENKPIDLNINRHSKYSNTYSDYYQDEVSFFDGYHVCVFPIHEISGVTLVAVFPQNILRIRKVLINIKSVLREEFEKSYDSYNSNINNLIDKANTKSIVSINHDIGHKKVIDLPVSEYRHIKWEYKRLESKKSYFLFNKVLLKKLKIIRLSESLKKSLVESGIQPDKVLIGNFIETTRYYLDNNKTLPTSEPITNVVDLSREQVENNIPDLTELSPEEQKEIAKKKRRYELKHFGEDLECGLHMPTPEEVPESWKWESFKPDNWGGMTKDNKIDEQLEILLKYIKNPDGFGRFVEQEVLYKDQLAELDADGLKILKNFFSRPSVKLDTNIELILDDIVPSKSKRTARESIPLDEIDPEKMSGAEYIRKRGNATRIRK